ncbi:hypothetical protein [Nocardia donostiensis]|uniref:PPOX class F420-dependent enzyme n=1 Tax=Nocardia donostiensis TaxID=1538463 RepID=A0A1W0BA81_9NOCA|nr:hypothetical protein [Nocardia donostiensis]ONM50041.1 hypothetical protein B0T46_02760 [Nocardia donostiensis]OQS19407.1 hypothetical protein B0T44_14495 [Nocardia donostiensis]
MTYPAETNHVVDATFPGNPGPYPQSNPRPYTPARPTPNLPAVPQRPSEWHPGMLWWDARTVLVTRRIAPGQWATVPRLVVPIDHGRLAFRVSSHSDEAQQLAQDRRIIVQAGDWRGRPALGSRQHQGTAHLVRGGPLLNKVREGIRIKYGMRVALARMAHRAALGSAPYADIAVIVTIHEGPPFVVP